jgi:3,4-dihydroxy-2-butanone 4-phosphate synthase
MYGRTIAFMSRQDCGLTCPALTEERVDALGLPMMQAFDGTRHETAFTIPIKAREGVTTGTSAATARGRSRQPSVWTSVTMISSAPVTSFC